MRRRGRLLMEFGLEILSFLIEVVRSSTPRASLFHQKLGWACGTRQSWSFLLAFPRGYLINDRAIIMPF